MAIDRSDNILSPKDNLAFIFGEHRFFVFENKDFDNDYNDFLKYAASTMTGDNSYIIGMRLSVARELLYRIMAIFGGRRIIRNTYGRITAKLRKDGFEILQSLSVFPNINSARFYFPYNDISSHRFLLKRILLPRKYSLKYIQRLLIGIYFILISGVKRSSFLYQGNYILVKRNEKTF